MSRDPGPCPAADDLERLLAEELVGPERDTVESHVELCTSCQEKLEKLSAVPAHLVAPRADSEPPADFLRRLRETPPPRLAPSGYASTGPLERVPLWFEHGRVGQYEVLEKLGRGGMGAVFKARHVELGKVVALKILPAEHMDEARIGRFKNEVRAIGRLNHPHIVAAHDAGEAGGVHYLVMDLVDGQDLGRVVERLGRLAVPDACEAVRQAALGLHHAFERGLVHRDIKPSNLMLTRAGRVQLLDLGLARSFGDRKAETLTAEGMVIGTADYLAPEQWEHAHSADIRADIYSLGCTLYHLLAGKPPFAGRGYGSLLQKLRGHIDTPHPPITGHRPEVPAGLAAIVDRMLAKSPADRFATPAEVADALSPFTAGADLGRLVEPGAANPETTSTADTADAPNTVAESRGGPAGNRSPARRFAGPLALVGLAAAVAIAAIILWPKRDQPTDPAAPSVAIDELRVNHYRGKEAKELGDLRTSEAVRKGDDVRVLARLNREAYCYLIAFNPDGTEQLCHPAFDGTDPRQARTVRPSPATEIRFFASDKEYFNLDTAGLQVFVLVASAEPLPSYAEWRAGVGDIPWRTVRHGGESRWQFDGSEFTRLAEVRGTRQERDPVPSALRELCESLKARAGGAVVRVVAFPVIEEDRARRLKALEVDLAREGKFEEAKEPVRELIDLHMKERGADHWQTLDEKRELQALERISALSEPDRAEYIRTTRLLDTTVVLQSRGHYPEAVAATKPALDMFGRALGRDHLITAQVAVHYGNLLRQSARAADAEPVLQDALAVVSRNVGNDHPTAVSARTALALVLEARGKFADARTLLDEAIDITRRLKGADHSDMAVLLNNLAAHLEKQAHYGDAEVHYRKALEIHLRGEGEEGRRVAETRHNLAHNLTNQGKYADGESLYRDVLRIRRKILNDGHPDIGATCNNLAINLDLQGRHSEAEPLNREVLESYRRRFGPENPFTAMAMNSLAMNLQNQGKYEEAEGLFEDALRVYAGAGYSGSRGAAIVHNNLAANLRAQRRYDAARDQMEKAQGILRGLLTESHPEVAHGYNNVAAILDDQKRYAEAEVLIRKALEIFEARLGKDHPETALVRANLAVNLHNQGKYAESGAGLRESLESYRRLLGEGHPGTAWTYRNLVTNLWARGDYGGAADLGPAASASFEAARRRVSLSGLDRVRRTDDISPHRHLAAIAARTGRAADAWHYLESGLARGLLDELIVRPLTDDERAREQKLMRELDRLDKRIAGLVGRKSMTDQEGELRRERDDLQRQLVAFQSELAARYGVAAGKVYSVAEIQKAIRPESALVVWLDIAGDPTLKDPSGEHWACVLRSVGEPEWVRLPGTGPDQAWGDEDDAMPSRVREAVASRAGTPGGEWKELAGKLHRQRLAPIEPALSARDGLPAVRHLIVLHSSAIAGLPVEALTDRFIVSYVPSGTMFAWLQEGRSVSAEKESLLALGDPAFGSGGAAPEVRGKPLAALPATRTELQSIARLFSRSQLLLGADASEQNLDRMAASGELRKFRFLHFATHGVLDDRRPLASALMLARPADSLGPTSHDGRLTAEQILRTWKLDADLVTLSACETGLGKFSRGEGYLGFSQALFLAGARGMVLSLWPVDDRATTLVMTRFYENMLGAREGQVKLSKAEALAEARKWLSSLSAGEVERLTADLPRGMPLGTRGTRREAEPSRDDAPRPFAHPYYWSAFILIGDPQ